VIAIMQHLAIFLYVIEHTCVCLLQIRLSLLWSHVSTETHMYIYNITPAHMEEHYIYTLFYLWGKLTFVSIISSLIFSIGLKYRGLSIAELGGKQ
jgi:hypothetical protein